MDDNAEFVDLTPMRVHRDSVQLNVADCNEFDTLLTVMYSI